MGRYIARWECPEHGADSGPGKRCGRMARPYVLCHRDKVKVEYVPADQLTRAVSVLREIADADPVDMALDPGWAARIAKAALAREE